VPHVGWNHVEIVNGEKQIGAVGSSSLMDNGEYFYFVHSYYVSPDNGRDVYTTTKYAGVTFCSSVSRDNIFTCQFHPEKSGAAGLRVLKSFLDKG
jgi:glutamine amidotransferase